MYQVATVLSDQIRGYLMLQNRTQIYNNHTIDER